MLVRCGRAGHVIETSKLCAIMFRLMDDMLLAEEELSMWHFQGVPLGRARTATSNAFILDEVASDCGYASGATNSPSVSHRDYGYSCGLCAWFLHHE